MRSILAALLVPLALVLAPLPAAEAAPATGTLTLSSTSVAAGGAVTASGSFRKAFAGRKVAIQVSAKGKWTTLAARSASSKGAYAVTVRVPSAQGKLKLRAYVAAKGKKAGAVSAVKTLKVTGSTGPGSSSAPYAVGQTFANGSWTFSFGATDTDAWPELQGQDEENVAPNPGWSYVMVPVVFTNASKRADEPYWPNDIQFLGADGSEYSELSDDDQICGIFENDWVEAPALAPGQSATLNVCAVVPTAAVAGGAWVVFNDDADDESYVKLS
jgi:hypothetical protein